MRWPHVVAIKVPWRDIDAAGHVNNAVYFSYMETARIEAFLEAVGGARPDEVAMILARAACDFVSPAFMHETLLVSVRPTRVGSTSFTFAYEIRDRASGRLVAKGESVQVAFDYGKQRKVPIPAPLRATLEAGLAGDAGPG